MPIEDPTHQESTSSVPKSKHHNNVEISMKAIFMSVLECKEPFCRDSSELVREISGNAFQIKADQFNIDKADNDPNRYINIMNSPSYSMTKDCIELYLTKMEQLIESDITNAIAARKELLQFQQELPVYRERIKQALRRFNSTFSRKDFIEFDENGYYRNDNNRLGTSYLNFMIKIGRTLLRE